MFDWPQFIFTGSVVLLLAYLLCDRLVDPALRPVILLGLLLRVVGSTLRLEVIEQAYGGAGDAKGYFRWGTIYAQHIADLDFGFVTTAPGSEERWWSTQFIRTVSGFVVFFTGENIRSAFLVFSVLAFVGIVLYISAFASAFRSVDPRRYALFVCMWPSIWFWPSSIGKEALLMFAVGLFVWGYVGSYDRPRWLALIAGLALAGAVRPHVGGFLSTTLVLAEVLRPGRLFSGGRLATGFVTVVGAVIMVSAGLERLGLDDADLEGIQEEIEFRSDKSAKGGSQISQASGVTAIPVGIATILFRPFPWEAGGIGALSSLEISGFWLIVFTRRKDLSGALADWRNNRLVRLGGPTLLGLAAMYGVVFANLGIIARQRVVLLPLLAILGSMPQRALGAKVVGEVRKRPLSLPPPIGSSRAAGPKGAGQ